MKKGVLVALILAGVCILLGIMVFVAAGARMLSGDTQKSGAFETHEQVVEEPFSSLLVSTSDETIIVLPTEDDVCRVTYTDTLRMRHTVEVIDGTLTVREIDQRSWLDYIGVLSSFSPVMVSLPKAQLETVSLEATSGSIRVTDVSAREGIKLLTTSGSITGSALEARRLSATATSGSVRLSDLALGDGALGTNVTSGSVTVERAQCGWIGVKTSSGGIRITDLTVSASDAAKPNQISATSGTVRLETCTIYGGCSVSASSGSLHLTDIRVGDTLQLSAKSGGIHLSRLDAKELWIQATSGSVTGSLKHPMRFETQTKSGSVHVPETTGDGLCTVITTSGSIKLTIEE